MDNLTHSLVGLALARAGLARRYGPGATATLILASNVQDLDALLGPLLGAELFVVRRIYTHSVLATPLLAAALAWAGGFQWRQIPRRALFCLALLGMAGHVLLDLLNSYGVVLLWPLSRERFELAWVFIVDLAMLAILAAPLAAGAWTRRHEARSSGDANPLPVSASERRARFALAGLSAYVALCGLASWRARAMLNDAIARSGRRSDFEYVFPEALGPHRFRGVSREGGQWRTWTLHLLDGRAEPWRTFATEDDTTAVRAVRATFAGREIEWFMKAPVWRTVADEVDPRSEPDAANPDAFGASGTQGSAAKSEVEVFDLRFRSFVLPTRATPFVYRLRATPDGRGARRLATRAAPAAGSDGVPQAGRGRDPSVTR